MPLQDKRSASSTRRRRTPRRVRALLAAMMAVGTSVAMPSAALAGSAENDSNVDARLIGYPGMKKVGIEKSSSTPAFLLLLLLLVVGCVPLFKNAKRD